MGLLTCRPDGAGDMADRLCKSSSVTKAFTNKPQRGKIFIEQKGYPAPSPVGATP